jgi:ParB family chromosome partitioning protein
VVASIASIIITERIRKEITGIPELAKDIMRNGLINPVTIMALDDGTFKLLAGLRRIKAAQMLGWTEIATYMVSPADAEAALRIEISENEQREPFTFSEKMDFARLLDEIEKAKALERMSIGGKGGITQGCDHGHYLEQGRRSDIIGEKIDMSGRQYDRAKYIADNAPPEVIDQLDRGERSIRGTYDELRAKNKSATLEEDTAIPFEKQDFETLSPEDKVKELQRQLADTETELALLKSKTDIAIDNKTSLIEGLKRENATLTKALEAANLRIAELGARHGETN